MKSSLIVSWIWGREGKDVQQGHTAWNFFSSRVLGSLILLFILQHPLVSIDGGRFGCIALSGPSRSRWACFGIDGPEDIEPHDRLIVRLNRWLIEPLMIKKSKRVSFSLSAISEAEDARTEVSLKVTNHPNNNNNTQSCLVYHPLYNGNYTRDRERPLQKAYNRSQCSQTKRNQERSIRVVST